MSQSDIAQNKRNLQKILDFPFGPSEPIPTATKPKKTTSVNQGSIAN